MKFVCKIKGVGSEKMDLFYIEKKQSVSQAFIKAFFALECVKTSDEFEKKKAEFVETVKNARELDAINHTKNFMTASRNKFIDLFYEREIAAKSNRVLFEDTL